MSTTTTNTKIQLRRDTAVNWASYNPTLSEGEPGVEIDTGKLKIGNGTTSWNGLKYITQEIQEALENKTNADIEINQTVSDIKKDIIKYMVENSITGVHFFNSGEYRAILKNAYSNYYYAVVTALTDGNKTYTSSNTFTLGSTVNAESITWSSIIEYIISDAEKDTVLNAKSLAVNATDGINLNSSNIVLNGTNWEAFKTSQATHPTRSEVAASYVNLTEAQTISGQKTFNAKTTFAAETNFNLNTNFAGTAQFNGTIKNKKMVGGTINMHPEGDLTNMAYFMNDLTGMLSLGGTCTCTRTDKDGNVLGEPLSEYNKKQWFNGTTSYGNLVSGGKWQSATPANEPAFAVTDIVTIDIDFSAWKNFAWTTTGGLGFGSASWRAKDVKVETNYSENGTLSTWREVYNVTNSSEAIHNFLAPGPTGTSGEKCNRVRITLTNFNSASEVRIAGIWMIGYNSKSLASTLVSRVDGTMISHFLPEKTNTYDLGSDTKRWNIVNANTIKANTVIPIPLYTIILSVTVFLFFFLESLLI